MMNHYQASNQVSERFINPPVDFSEPMDETLELNFNDISQIRRNDEITHFGYNNPADMSSISDVGFLNQLKNAEFKKHKIRKGNTSYRPRREKASKGSTPGRKYAVIKSTIGQLKNNIVR